jgi:hypothetical protein
METSIPPSLKFSLKHYFPSLKGINLDYFKKIYPRLPGFITTLPKFPHIDDFKSDLNGKYEDDYVSTKKIEINMINTSNGTITNMHAFVHITFIKRGKTYHPVHIYHLDLKTAAIHSINNIEDFY